MKPTIKHWVVSTPEYEYEEWVDGWILADRYPVTDFTYVGATTKREAIRKGVAELRAKKQYRDYYHWYWDDHTNPFTGVKAVKAVCEHGYHYCDTNAFKCPNTIEDCTDCMAMDS